MDFTKSFNRQGQMVAADGNTRQAFFRFRAQPQDKERAALQFIEPFGFPAPQFLGMIQLPEGSILAQSYIEGVDLDDLLPTSQERPVLPGQKPPTSHPLSATQLAPAVMELGRIIAHLHSIRAPHFGNLLTPSKDNGVNFTLEKVQLLLAKSIQRGWFSQQAADQIAAWLSERIHCLWKDKTPCLVHSDLHPANIRVQNEEDGQYHIQGLIDFEHTKGWYAEYDLVVLRWHLLAALWPAFIDGYGPINEERLAVFEIVKLLMIVSGWPLDYPYAQWAFHKLFHHFPALTLSATRK